jgi:hypothetical protein
MALEHGEPSQAPIPETLQQARESDKGKQSDMIGRHLLYATKAVEKSLERESTVGRG